jgi:hypothetical protein
LDQFRVLINSGYTNFESLGTIEPITSIAERPVYAGSVTITSGSNLPDFNSLSMSDPKFFSLFESRFRALTK